MRWVKLMSVNVTEVIQRTFIPRGVNDNSGGRREVEGNKTLWLTEASQWDTAAEKNVGFNLFDGLFFFFTKLGNLNQNRFLNLNWECNDFKSTVEISQRSSWRSHFITLQWTKFYTNDENVAKAEHGQTNKELIEK